MSSGPDGPTEKIKILGMSSAGSPNGLVTLVLGEQLCCIQCGRVSTRWQIPAQIPGPASPGGQAGHDPGE